MKIRRETPISLHFYCKQENKKITLAVWDLDDTMGQCFAADPPPHPDYVSYDSWPMLPTQIGLMLYRSNYKNFRKKEKSRLNTILIIHAKKMMTNTGIKHEVTSMTATASMNLLNRPVT